MFWSWEFSGERERTLGGGEQGKKQKPFILFWECFHYKLMLTMINIF